MLLWCPALVELELCMYNNMREIVSHELYKRGVDSSAWSRGRTARGRIVAPALRSLTMAGPRDMECGLLSDFLTAMFPNLEALVADGWIGFHADEFLGFLRSAAPNNNEVKRMKLNFRKDEPDRQGLLVLGLVPETQELGNRSVLPVRFSFSGIPYRVLKTASSNDESYAFWGREEYF
ncbi:hypothetical protein BGX29_011974 [Mortierella sp. GBA35]|nr:hypothetical protein BGX29_011974 [Mortierella sp. GBA35]